MQIHLENIGLGELQSLPVRVRKLGLVGPHQPVCQEGREAWTYINPRSTEETA